jgi:hypothetical protein
MHVNNQKSKNNNRKIYEHNIKNIFVITNIDAIKYLLDLFDDDEINSFIISNCDYSILTKISNDLTGKRYVKIKKIS